MPSSIFFTIYFLSSDFTFSFVAIDGKAGSNGDDEKVNIETIFWSAMDMLSDDDKKLPQASFITFLF